LETANSAVVAFIAVQHTAMSCDSQLSLVSHPGAAIRSVWLPCAVISSRG